MTPARYPSQDPAQAYLELVLNQNRQDALNMIMDLVDKGTSIRSIYLDIFQPAMHLVGELWQHDRISVAQEHYCTGVTQFIISQLYPYLFREHDRDRAMAGCCVSGELHEMGIRMVCDFFEMDGWDSYYLGANTPAEALIEFIADKNADLLAISVTMTFHLPRARALVRTVREHFGSELKIILGGYPFGRSATLCDRIGGDGYSLDAQSAVDLGNRLTGGSHVR
jgi:methanogenic corrinoid protein MtbC1